MCGRLSVETRCATLCAWEPGTSWHFYSWTRNRLFFLFPSPWQTGQGAAASYSVNKPARVLVTLNELSHFSSKIPKYIYMLVSVSGLSRGSWCISTWQVKYSPDVVGEQLESTVVANCSSETSETSNPKCLGTTLFDSLTARWQINGGRQRDQFLFSPV